MNSNNERKKQEMILKNEGKKLAISIKIGLFVVVVLFLTFMYYFVSNEIKEGERVEKINAREEQKQKIKEEKREKEVLQKSKKEYIYCLKDLYKKQIKEFQRLKTTNIDKPIYLLDSTPRRSYNTVAKCLTSKYKWNDEKSNDFYWSGGVGSEDGVSKESEKVWHSIYTLMEEYEEGSKFRPYVSTD